MMKIPRPTHLISLAASSTPSRSVLIALFTIGVAAVAGVIVGIIAIVRAKQRKRLELIALSDELTGVGNRRRLDRDLAMDAADADTPVAVIKVDIDGFERINHDHGRHAGDIVLRHVADVMRDQVRSGDVVYRCEHDEFCVLLAKTTSGEAGQVAERIRSGVSDMTLDVDGSLTVSIGVALGRGEHVKQTMLRADDALAKSKEDGRDRVTLAAQPLLGPLAVTHHLDAAPSATFG